MRINFYKLFFTFLFIIISGVGFAQTTVTFEGSSYTPGTENYYGKNLDFPVSGRTLRFNYDNATTTTGTTEEPTSTLDDGNDRQLYFGVSLGFISQRLENADIYGNPNDPTVGQYNTRKTYLDGDFGIAYTSNKLSIQASIPNLKSVLKKDVVKLADVATFYTTVGYKIGISEGIEGMDIEPEQIKYKLGLIS